jgi:DnaJ-class molecular chaperone
LLFRGNHYVKVVVTIPSEITEKQRELLLEFAKEASKVKEGIGKNAAYEGRQKSNDDEW